MSGIEVVPADGRIPFDDVVAVFGERGDASRCFCQFFCSPRGEFRSSHSRNMQALKDQVETYTPGLVAYRDGQSAGWAQIGPMERYPRFEAGARYGSKTPDPPAGTWALTCFVVSVGHRKQGVAGSLLDAAVAFAANAGASAIDAHPVDVRGGGARPSGSELYVGVQSLFTRRGFRVVGRTSPRRPVVRRRLHPNGATLGV